MTGTGIRTGTAAPAAPVADFAVASLAGRILPADGPLLRDHVRPANRRSDHYLERYDRTTLWYDCVYLDARGSYLFTAPRFLNLWRPFRRGLAQGGAPVRRVRRRTWLRCEQVEVTAPLGALSLDLGAGPEPVAARQATAAGFAGLNCLVAVNKNNPLDWIAGWAGYHARVHGAEGVVLFDNGSTDYAAEDIAARLAQVPGLARALVFRAPYPYGPGDKALRREVSPRFFQTAMLNLARRDPLARARAVLSIDIDELVTGGRNGTVFDAACRHPLGLVTIPGSWVYPAPGTDGPVDHRAHVWRESPDRATNQKWCIRPGGIMDRFGWGVHRVDEVFQNLLTRQDAFRLLHCRGTSTGWKAKRFELPETLVRDESLAALMTAEFPDQPSVAGPGDVSSSPEGAG